MDNLYWGLGGLIFGAAGAAFMLWRQPEIETKIIEKTIEVEKQLTDVHVLKEVCSAEFIVNQKRGNALCRLLWCRANTRNAIGTAQSATSKECEAVSNLISKQSMIETCTQFSKEDTSTAPQRKLKFDECISIFDRRI
jgi:hypothetical protein